MKKLIKLISFNLIINAAWAQSDSLKLKDLAVPSSPAFIITDITPSLIQTPTTPKEFILGVAQSYQQSSDGFPQNYSAEFSPYWWFNRSNRNVYSLVGLKTIKKDGFVTSTNGQDPFSGLKFTSISLAFLNKDLIPDTVKLSHKVFSVGIRTSVVKVYLKGHTETIDSRIKEWHTKTLADSFLIDIQNRLARADDSATTAKLNAELKKINTLKSQKTTDIVKEINKLMNEKPIFSWDIAAAYATYGIGDSVWKSGRSGIWTTLSSYIPLDFGGEKTNNNYFNLNFAFRYLSDNYFKDKKGVIRRSNTVDIGGKLALEFDKLSIGVESLYRFSNGKGSSQNRTVGIINYKIADNIYLNGAYGKNFDTPNKLVALFGLNWGIGSESLSLPKK